MNDKQLQKEMESLLNKLGLKTEKESIPRGHYFIKTDKNSKKVIIDNNDNKVKGFIICAKCRNSEKGKKYLQERFGEVVVDYSFGGTKSNKPCNLCNDKK